MFMREFPWLLDYFQEIWTLYELLVAGSSFFVSGSPEEYSLGDDFRNCYRIQRSWLGTCTCVSLRRFHILLVARGAQETVDFLGYDFLVHQRCMLMRQSMESGDFNVFLREADPEVDSGVQLSPGNLDVVSTRPL